MRSSNRTLFVLEGKRWSLVEADIPAYAVFGNHDYGMNYSDSVKNEFLANAIRRTLSQAGVCVLENEAVPLVLPDENTAPKDSTGKSDSALYFAGIGLHYAGNAKPKIALAQIPEGAPLALAGHTHGGQISLPFTEDCLWTALVMNEEVQADGWIENYGQTGTCLYVNRGIGFSTFPLRINCRPELTVFTLKGGNN